MAVLGSPDKLEAFLGRCGGGKEAGKGKKAGKDGALWGGCVLLFSDKKQTSPLYKSLSSQYAGKLAFGEVLSLPVLVSKPVASIFGHLASGQIGWDNDEFACKMVEHQISILPISLFGSADLSLSKSCKECAQEWLKPTESLL